MSIMDRLAAPLRGLVEWQEHHAAAAERHRREVEEQWRARHQAYVHEVTAEFAEAERIRLRRYRDLSIGEGRQGRIPAVEYFHSSATVRLYHLLEPELMLNASLIKALGMRLDGPAGDVDERDADVIDVKPTDMAPVEHGVVNLGPVLEFHNAEGTRWRFFLELSYSGAAGSFRGGMRSRRITADCTL